MLEFYFAPGSSSLAPHVALIEAGADFKPVPIMLAKGEQKTGAFLAVNPRGRIPALAVDGQVITEVLALLTYVATRYPDARLLPLDDALALARAYERMSLYASTMHVAIAQTWRTERFTPEESLWPELKRAAQQSLEVEFAWTDTQLTGPWVMGADYSVVDAYTYLFWRWGERLGLDMNHYARWAAQTERFLARPAVQEALAQERAATANAG